MRDSLVRAGADGNRMETQGLSRVDLARSAIPNSPFALPSRARFWLTALAFVVVYLALNLVTTTRQFRESGITAWSPDNGLSLLLLTESTLYAPIVFVAELLSDLFIHNVGHNIFIAGSSEFVLTAEYLFIAMALRDIFKFDIRVVSLKNVLAVLAIVPASAALTALLYCGVLFLGGALPPGQFYAAAYDFWVGDTVGMVVVLPAATAIYDLVQHSGWRRRLTAAKFIQTILIGLCVALLVYLSADTRPGNISLFYLLFLPIIWVGINYGFLPTAILLLYIQLLLISVLTGRQIGNNEFSIFQTLMFILASTGQLLGAVVTEREQATRLLRTQQSDLARVSSQATTGAMAVSLAHEISQPLSSLSGYVHSARRMLDSGQAGEQVAAALAKAEAEARRAREIIERIRDFVSSGRLEYERIDLNQVARKIISLNVEEAATRRVELDAEYSDPAAIVTADRIAIEQALNNLVVNAIEAAAERGGSSGHVVVRASLEADWAVLAVDDDGPGVAPEIADNLFEVFQTTKPKGMGLGLPLTLQIAQKHAGRLNWRPREPRGVSFSLRLPIGGNEHDSG